MPEWTTPTLKKGETVSREINGCVCTIEHVDRRGDPYLAGCWVGHRLVYTGLHQTLADARKTVADRANFVDNKK